MAELDPMTIPVKLDVQPLSGGLVGSIRDALFGAPIVAKEVGIVKDFLTRLTSRKFIVAAVAAGIALSQHDDTAALTVVLTYLGFEGTADIVTRVKS